MLEVFVATQNQGKQREIKEILKMISREIKKDIIPIFPSEKETVPENGKTYLENALSKAFWWREKRNMKKIPIISEDSGIEIFALDKFPGVMSSLVPHRDSTDIDRCLFILHKMKGISNREARYVSYVVILLPEEDIWFSDFGETYGIIADEIKGNGGFGYDPIFYLPEIGKTFGEAHLEEKIIHSHRWKAFKKLTKVFEKL